MPIPRSATVTPSDREDPQETIRVTLNRRAIPAALRPTAATLIALALADFAAYEVLGGSPVDHSWCYVALIVGVGMWITAGQHRIERELHAELEHQRARSDLCSLLGVLIRIHR